MAWNAIDHSARPPPEGENRLGDPFVYGGKVVQRFVQSIKAVDLKVLRETRDRWMAPGTQIDFVRS
jgi:hypothetical protein